MRKRDYSDQNVETWNALMEEVAAEAAFMADDGVVASNGLRFWGVVLGIVGDWPFLHKSGGFCRSFNNIQKRKTQKNLPVGICHLCQGGQRHTRLNNWKRDGLCGDLQCLRKIRLSCPTLWP